MLLREGKGENTNAKVWTPPVVLGTLLSDKSLAAGQYYANPRNDFWKLVPYAP